jgi:hypothetical protein
VRRGSGLRQEDLVLSTNVSVKFISDLERGKETAPFRLVLEVVQNLGGRLEVNVPKPEQVDGATWPRRVGPLVASRDLRLAKQGPTAVTHFETARARRSWRPSPGKEWEPLAMFDLRLRCGRSRASPFDP